MSIFMKNAEDSNFLTMAKDFIAERGSVIIGVNPSRMYKLLQSDLEEAYVNKEEDIDVRYVYLDDTMKFYMCLSICDYFVYNWSVFFIQYTSKHDEVEAISRLIRTVFSGIFGAVIGESDDVYPEDMKVKKYVIYLIEGIDSIETYIRDAIIPYKNRNKIQSQFEGDFYDNKITNAIYNLRLYDRHEEDDVFERALEACNDIRLRCEILRDTYVEEAKVHLAELEIAEKIVRFLKDTDKFNQKLYHLDVSYVGANIFYEITDNNCISVMVLDDYIGNGRLLTVSIKKDQLHTYSVRLSVYTNGKKEILTNTFILDDECCDSKISIIVPLINELLSEHWDDIIIEESNNDEEFNSFMANLHDSMKSMMSHEQQDVNPSEPNEDNSNEDDIEEDFGTDMTDDELLRLKPSKLLTYYMNKGYRDKVSDNTMDLISYAKKMCEEFTRRMGIDKKDNKSE